MIMNRNICIVNKHIANYTNFDSISYQNIDSIINFSVDNMICDMLNTIDAEEGKGLLDSMLQKIRLGGKLILAVDNLELLCKNYLNGIVDGKTFLSLLHNIQNIVSVVDLENIITRYSSHFKLIQSELLDTRAMIVLQREAL